MTEVASEDARRAGVRFTSGTVEGAWYQDLEPGFEERLRAWLEAGRVPEGEELKAERVYRVERFIVKFYPPSRSLKDRLRPVPAFRIARLYERLLPIATPRPVAALRARRGPAAGRSMLVMEHVDGRSLNGVVKAGDEAALEALPRFLAEMHRRGIFHGDQHVDQILWDGGRWVQLDLDGLRHRLRTLLRRPLIETEWARLECGIRESGVVRPLFLRYLEHAGLAWQPERAWARVAKRVQRLRANRR